MRKLIGCFLLVATTGCSSMPTWLGGHKEESLLPSAKYELTKTVPVSGDGRWDYVAFDPAAKLLYVPRQSHTQVFDPASDTVVADIPNTNGVHGVALAPDAGRGFASDGKDNNVTIFDLKTHAVLGTTPVGNKPDAIIYDPYSKCVFAFNGESSSTSVIDPTAAPGAPVKATIPLGGGPEFAASDRAGHVYVNLEDESEIVSIDTKEMKVDATWKIEGGESPSGLAIDAAHHVLFSGCRNQVMAIVDTQTGKTITTVPIGSGVDACAFNTQTGEAFASCGDGTVTVVKETSPGKFEVTQTIQTKVGARTMTIDPTTHTLYLPTAEFLPKAEGEKRPQMKDGTFMILEVTRAK